MECTAATASPTIGSSVVYSGSRSMTIDALGSGVAKGMRYNFASAAGNGPYFFFVRFRVDTAPSADNCILQWNDTNAYTTPIGYATIDNSRVIRFYDEDSQITGTSTPSASTWVYIEGKVDRTGAAGSHIVEFRVDGTVIASRTNANLSAGVLTFNVGGNLLLEANTTGTWYFDDVIVCDSTTSYMNDYLGDIKGLEALRPDGAGTSTQWTRGGTDSGANWSQLEETPPNDVTDYVLSNTLDQIDIYTLGNTPASILSGDTIVGVFPGVRFAVDTSTGADPDITVGVVVSGNHDESGAIDVSNTSWRTNDTGGVVVKYPELANSSNYEVPNTSSAYTKTDLDGMSYRLRQAATDTHNALVSAVWVYVAHKASPSTLVKDMIGGMIPFAR